MPGMGVDFLFLFSFFVCFFALSRTYYCIGANEVSFRKERGKIDITRAS